MEVSVSKLDNYTAVVIDGKLIEGVEDYKIASSADGTTELTIHIKFNANIAKYDILQQISIERSGEDENRGDTQGDC